MSLLPILTLNFWVLAAERLWWNHVFAALAELLTLRCAQPFLLCVSVVCGLYLSVGVKHTSATCALQSARQGSWPVWALDTYIYGRSTE